MGATGGVVRTPKEIILRFPEALPDVDHWLVMGLDPSLSRTGYAMMHVILPEDPHKGQPCKHPGCLSHVSHPCEECGRTAGMFGTYADWTQVGSVKPDSSKDPIWIRSKGISLFLKERLSEAATTIKFEDFLAINNGQPSVTPIHTMGLLIATEHPTPTNDYLVALNRIMHLVLFDGDLWKKFAVVKILSINASTLRSLMGLSQRGTTNKKENILKAYEFIDKTRFPALDPDSCDAVLLAMMGRYVSSILLGRPREIPERVLQSLCNSAQISKGKGRNQHFVTAGVLHRPEYFYEYQKLTFKFLSRDASSTERKLDVCEYQI